MFKHKLKRQYVQAKAKLQYVQAKAKTAASSS